MVPTFGFHDFPGIFVVWFQAFVSAYGKSQFSAAHRADGDFVSMFLQ
jgi:hypothetical protein